MKIEKFKMVDAELQFPLSGGNSKEDVQFNSQLIVRKELTICGSRNALLVFPAVIQMFEKKEKPYTSLISKVFPFSQVEDAFKYWDANPGKVNKVLINVKG